MTDAQEDDASLHVLEAVLIALILLGAAYGVSSLRSAGLEPERPRAQLGSIAGDALIVLEGINEGDGSLLDIYLAEAIRCTQNTSATRIPGCIDSRSAALSMKLESYLPRGGAYALSLSNGASTREVYRSPQPAGEIVASSLSFTPSWNHTFLMTDLSCYQSGMSATVSVAPLLRAGVSTLHPTRINLTTGQPPAPIGAAAVAAHEAGWYNVTIAGVSAARTIDAKIAGKGTLNGTTAFGLCDLGGDGADIVAAARTLLYHASARKIPLGTSTDFTIDLRPMEDPSLLPLISLGSGIQIKAANITIYEPLPPIAREADTWAATAILPVDWNATDTVTWRPMDGALYGTHVAVLRVLLDLPGSASDVEIRRAIPLEVALPRVGGEAPIVPIDPPYRVILQTWIPDWG